MRRHGAAVGTSVEKPLLVDVCVRAPLRVEVDSEAGERAPRGRRPEVARRIHIAQRAAPRVADRRAEDLGHSEGHRPLGRHRRQQRKISERKNEVFPEGKMKVSRRRNKGFPKEKLRFPEGKTKVFRRKNEGLSKEKQRFPEGKTKDFPRKNK